MSASLHSPRRAVKRSFIWFLNLVLSLAWVTWGGKEFHLVMALFNTVCFPASLLDLGTAKIPLVACLVWYAWVSKLCANCLNRQFGTFNASTPHTKTNQSIEGILTGCITTWYATAWHRTATRYRGWCIRPSTSLVPELHAIQDLYTRRC
jgi:hypothetical protein